MDARSTFLLFLLPGLLGTGLDAADPLSRTFRAGGRVEMQLQAGEYDIRPADGDLLSVAITGSRTERVQVHLEGTESAARIAVTSGRKSRFRAVIQVPARCDLVVRHSAGELRIGAIRGHKDLRLRAGNLTLEVGDPKDYAYVYASVSAGELDARPFQRNTGGLFRTLRWTGTGPYDLRARVWAGEMVLK